MKIPHHTLALQDQHFEHLRIDEENLEDVLPQYTLALHDLFENSLSSAVFVTCVFLKLDGNESLRMEWAEKGGAPFLSPPTSQTFSFSKHMWSIIAISSLANML